MCELHGDERLEDGALLQWSAGLVEARMRLRPPNVGLRAERARRDSSSRALLNYGAGAGRITWADEQWDKV